MLSLLDELDWNQIEIQSVKFSKRAKPANVNITALWVKIDFIIKQNFNINNDDYYIGSMIGSGRERHECLLYIDHGCIMKIVKDIYTAKGERLEH